MLTTLPAAKKIMEALKELNILEIKLEKTRLHDAKDEIQKEIDKLKKVLPRQILSHHERVRVRGRSSVALVDRNTWVCKGCHIGVPRGLHSKLHKVDDITVCENCGSYLYIDHDQAVIEPEPKTKAKPAKKVAKK